MEKINTKIKKTIFKIILIITIIPLSALFWGYFDFSDYAHYAEKNKDSSSESVVIKKYGNFVVNNIDSYETSDSNIMVEISSNAKIKTPYKLVLKAHKSLPYEKLIIRINKKYNSLKEQLIDEDQDCFYFLINENVLENNIEQYEVGLYAHTEEISTILWHDYQMDFINYN